MLEAPPHDVLERLEASETLAEAVKILRMWAGSHDKLAGTLGTSRQRVIGWEQGQAPRAAYRDQLLALGVPARFFVTVSRADLEQRLTKVEKEAQEIRVLLEALSH